MDAQKIELLQKSISGVLKRIEADLKKADVQLSPAGPNGDLAEQFGHADGEQLQRADKDDLQGVPAKAPDASADGAAKEAGVGESDKDDDDDKKKAPAAEASAGEGDEPKKGEFNDEETMKAEAEVLEMLKGLIDDNPDLLKGALFSLLDEAGFFDEETAPADQGLNKTEELAASIGSATTGIEELSKSLNEFISATNDRIVSLSAQVEALASRPIGPRRAVTQQIQPLMKGEEGVQSAQEKNPLAGLSKSEAAERLYGLQREGVIRGHDVQMFIAADVLTENARQALNRNK